MSLWTKLRDWFLGEVKEEALRGIKKMDKWEPKLADLIRERLNPDDKAKQLVDLLQVELHKMADKISGTSWWTKMFGIKSRLHEAVDSLDEYEDDLAGIIKKHLNADEKAKLVVDYMQGWLTKWIEKIFD